ncbi:unnamed protein product [Ranitomeya imitator]|uniref:Ubiquitin-like protease family profile domain-containing protein n=1 Tax=Ranitomeya imitator TaxID=111125 RepID=A0ABN9LJ61_9NEOB|nr:unnamed protein product [Ranitomeya imitator]
MSRYSRDITDFLRFAVLQDHFQFVALPFGLATAPSVFTKTMVALMAILRVRGLVVDFRRKTVTYYDSMGGLNNEACRILLQYLKQESQDKKGISFDTNGWNLSSKTSDEIPQQMNGSDCGMFACKYADYITKDKSITFTQNHMPYFRKRMVYEIIHQKLL